MLTFHTCDVFTDRTYAGNPLAIVLGADGLTDAQMQTIAREFNLSEISPTAGIPEDPATGSASAILAAQLLVCGALAEGETRLTLHQGVEMGRPSVIGLTARVAGWIRCGLRAALCRCQKGGSPHPRQSRTRYRRRDPKNFRRKFLGGGNRS